MITIGPTAHQHMSWRECASAPRRSNRPTGLVWSGATTGREAAVALSVMPSMCSSSAPDLGVYRCNEAGTGSGRHVRQQGPSRYPGRQICQVRVLVRPAAGTGPRWVQREVVARASARADARAVRWRAARVVAWSRLALSGLGGSSRFRRQLMWPAHR